MSGCPRWKGLAWGMLPCLGSAMCACTWHFFYNSPDLEARRGCSRGRLGNAGSGGRRAVFDSPLPPPPLPLQRWLVPDAPTAAAAAPPLQFLVATQAALTVLGNFTCWFAAWRIYAWSQEQEAGA